MALVESWSVPVDQFHFASVVVCLAVQGTSNFANFSSWRNQLQTETPYENFNTKLETNENNLFAPRNTFLINIIEGVGSNVKE